MPGKKDARAPGKPFSKYTRNCAFSRNGALIYSSKHIACHSNTIKISSVNSNYYRVDDLISIIRNPCEIEKFRIQGWNFSNFFPGQKYFLND